MAGEGKETCVAGERSELYRPRSADLSAGWPMPILFNKTRLGFSLPDGLAF